MPLEGGWTACSGALFNVWLALGTFHNCLNAKSILTIV